MINTLLQFNLQRQWDPIREYIDRPYYWTLLDKYTTLFPITLLVWMRRTWKTTLSKLWIKNQIAQWVDPRTFCFVSCDHFLLQQYTLFDIITTVRSYHWFSVSQPITMVFDEITSISDYQQQLKNIADLWHTRVIASSSQSSVLYDEKAFLTWRAWTIEVFPLNFEEYLDFRALQIAPADTHLRTKYFEEYLRDGGIPEYVLTWRPEIIKEIINDLIYKDIIARHGIRDKQVVQDLFMLLLERNWKQISINKISNILWVTNDSIKRYLWYMQDTYLFYQVMRDGKTNEKIRSAKKWYVNDTWIKHVMTWRKDIWFAYETACCHARRQQWKTPYYGYINWVEVDRSIEGQLYESKYGTWLSPSQEKIKELIILDWLAWYQKILHT
jgi:predicted AAA+ superfamily ATPase